MQEFLNPKSMLTPGVAGATMMFLVNGLSVPFPEVPARYAALALSFIIGAVVFNADKIKFVERGVYWVLNSLVIFVVGFGTASLGYEATADAAARGAGLTPSGHERVASAWLVRTAQAANDPQSSPATRPGAADPGKGAVTTAAVRAAEAEKARLELETLRRENERLKQEAQSGAKPPPEPRSFFRKW